MLDSIDMGQYQMTNYLINNNGDALVENRLQKIMLPSILL